MKDRIIDTLCSIAMPFVVAVMVIGLSIACHAEAAAAMVEAGSAEYIETQAESCETSLPYVEDVNEWGKKKVIATVVCYGGKSPFKLKVTDTKTKKKVTAEKVKTGVWTVVLKKGRTYKISVKAKGCKYKSIKFEVC